MLLLQINTLHVSQFIAQEVEILEEALFVTMLNLVKQVRVRFSGAENTEEPGSIKDRRIPPQKTQSFKGEKKRGQSWFQRQFSKNMSQDYNSNNDMEHATAVAAAAYAINSLQDSGVPDKKKTSEAPERSLIKLKSKKEDATISMPETGTESKRFSGKGSMKSSEGTDSMVPIIAAEDVKAPQKAVAPAPSLKKTPTFADGKKPEKTVARAPSIKKTTSFAGEQLNGAGSMKPESEAPKLDLPTIKPVPKPDRPTIKPGSTAPTETKAQSSTRPGIGETKADAWEKAEMAKIKERYEKVNSTILTWENKKKADSNRKLHRTESELESRRAKALQKYSSDMQSINQIAGGARAKAEERRRNEEFKAKEKANIIRTTGEIPKTCFCF